MFASRVPIRTAATNWLPAMVCVLVVSCAGLSAEDAEKERKLDNAFFAFDNGVGRGKWTPKQQAELLKELGYAGIGYSGAGSLDERLPAFDAAGLKIFSLYVWSRVGPNGPTFDPALPAAIKRLKGRDTILWLTVQGRAPNADDQAVEVVRKIGDLAAESKLRVVLYPHLGFHVAKVDDAIRIATKVDRKNVGVSFNLCHWLKENDQKNLRPLLKRALPKLFLVSINGADHEGGWDRLIQPLDRGAYDVFALMKELKALGYDGPVGLQCYNIKDAPRVHLPRSIRRWREFQSRMKTD